jgi:hypothetical protein
MNYAEVIVTAPDVSRESYKIRAPQFDNLAEAEFELDPDRITELVNKAIAFKMQSKVRARMREFPNVHPQVLVWEIESDGIEELLYPTRRPHSAITISGNFAAALTSEQLTILAKAGVKIASESEP